MAQNTCYGLDEQQLARFKREGFLLVEDLLDDSILQPVIDEVTEEIERRAVGLIQEGLLSRSYTEYGFERQLAMISKETDKLARAIWNGNLTGPAFFNLIRNPRLLDVAEQFCGPEIIASAGYRLRPKIPNYHYGAVPWHQDSGYAEPYCDNSLMITVWVPLIDATAENGCLWFIPGAHHGEVVTHRENADHTYLEIPPEELPAGEPVCVPVRKGGVLLFTNLTPHVSYENRSDIVRWSMDLRYQSAALPTNAMVTRLEGEEVYDTARGVPPACYPPEADFLVRSAQRPAEVIQDAGRFREIRETHQYLPVTTRWS
ncbi:MAG TPA: phytanoyl-CoA dioxygenase family protein [Chthonomonadales bacterium]|nr:phytanoyl-CoA dioxygenase family protein [Chthonomonadales bacterium]